MSNDFKKGFVYPSYHDGSEPKLFQVVATTPETFRVVEIKKEGNSYPFVNRYWKYKGKRSEDPVLKHIHHNYNCDSPRSFCYPDEFEYIDSWDTLGHISALDKRGSRK